MPKIIENLKEQIVEEARKQLFENGYSKTTIRSVASALGIGTGTLYNHFKSKDMLISSFMLEDWHLATDNMRNLDASDKFRFLEGIHSSLSEFIDKYRFLFIDKEASATYFSVFSQRHHQLVGVIANIISPVCKDSVDVDHDFLAAHIAESMLFWTLQETPFDIQLSILKKLLQ